MMEMTARIREKMFFTRYSEAARSMLLMTRRPSATTEGMEEKSEFISTRSEIWAATSLPEAMATLCEAMNEAWQAETFDKLLLMPMFVLDFLCIHPFNDGNGRMSRLLTLLLLYKSGCIVGKYISLEMIIEASKDTYYDALQRSSQGWHDGANDYAPFVTYYLGIVLKAYREFESRVRLMQDRSLSKPERIRALIDDHIGKITKSQIMAQCPDISKITVERTLTDLVKTGYLRKVGAGRATAYVKASDVDD